MREQLVSGLRQVGAVGLRSCGSGGFPQSHPQLVRDEGQALKQEELGLGRSTFPRKVSS